MFLRVMRVWLAFGMDMGIIAGEPADCPEAATWLSDQRSSVARCHSARN